MDSNFKLNLGANKVLVVDDDDTIVDVVSTVLTQMGCEVVSACNGDRGLELFQQNRFDAVMTDFDMPGMDGLTLAAHIKKTCRETLVVLMTGHDRETIMGYIANSEVDVALFKPFDLFSIVQALSEGQTRREEELLSAVR